MRKMDTIPGLIVVLLGNGLALMQVAENRAHAPVQTIILTERELPLQPHEMDDTSVSLNLAWRTRHSDQAPRPRFGEPLFDADELRRLGIHCPPPDESLNMPRPLPSVVYVAFEYEPESADPDQKDEIEQPVKGDGNGNREVIVKNGARTPATSRLFFVDASRSPELLSDKFAAGRRYLVVRALVAAFLDGGRNQAGAGKTRRWGGYITEILPSSISVPAPYAQLLARFQSPHSGTPRYQVTLHYGRKMEPWVGAVELQTRRP